MDQLTEYPQSCALVFGSRGVIEMAAAALHDAADMGPFNASMSVEPYSGAVGEAKHVAGGLARAASPIQTCQVLGPS